MNKNVTVFLLMFAAIAIVMGLFRKQEPTNNANIIQEIAVVPKGLTHDFWKAAHAGAQKAGEEFGYHILWNGPPTESDREKQISIVEDFLNKKVVGLALAPLDDTALVPIVEKAARLKVPCTIFDSGINTENYLSFVATDNYKGGAMAARRMAEILEGQGKVAVMKYAPNSASTTKRENGFIDAIKQEFPEIEIVEERYGQTTVASALEAAEDILSRHPSLDGLFACNESTTVGSLQALRSQGRHQKVKLIGFDSSEPLIAGLQQGDIDALVVQNPFMMGYLSVKAIHDARLGVPVSRRIDTGVTLVKNDNLSQPDVKSLLGL